jgi:hypothetical protein
MTYTEDQLWDLLSQSGSLPYGPGQIALVEQVIGHADAQHLPQLAFAARMHGINAYHYGGEPARAMVVFAWCLAEFDRDARAYERFQHTLLWFFKYMIISLNRFPEVPLEQTYAVLDDMQRRWNETGHSLHAVHAYRHRVASHIGDVAAAERHYELWCAAPRDQLSDCVGCDPSSKAWWLAGRGRDEEAIAIAEPVLDGHLTCREQPQSIQTTLMGPYLRTGRLDQARDAHRQAYRRQRPHLHNLENIADHVEFCARTTNTARAIEITERHLGWLDRAPSPWAELVFAATASYALRAAQHERADLSVLRPEHRDRPAARVGAADLAEELSARAVALAERFDRRNGTSAVGTFTRSRLEGPPWIDRLPLTTEHLGR